MTITFGVNLFGTWSRFGAALILSLRSAHSQILEWAEKRSGASSNVVVGDFGIAIRSSILTLADSFVDLRAKTNEIPQFF